MSCRACGCPGRGTCRCACGECTWSYAEATRATIARIDRNVAACRELGVSYGPGTVRQPFADIDRVWTVAPERQR